MKYTNPLIMSAVSGIFAIGVASAGPAPVQKNADKCYGVVKAGKNDCQTANSACAGTSTKDGQKDAWVYVPKGTCDKLVGGSMKMDKM